MENKKNNWTQFQHKPLRFMFFVMKQNKLYAFVAMGSVIVATFIDGTAHYFLRNLTNSLNATEINQVYFWAIILVLSIFISNLFWRISGYNGMRWTTFSIIISIKTSFNYLLKHSHRYFSERLSGSLLSKVSNIENSVGAILPMFLWNFLRITIKFSVSIFLAFLVSPSIGLIFIFFITIFTLFNFFVSKKGSLYSKTKANKGSELRGRMVDVFGNILATKQNVSMQYESKALSGFGEKYRKAYVRSWFYTEKIIFINNTLIVIAIGLILGVALHLWEDGLVSVGDVIMLTSMLFVLYGDLEFLGQTFKRFMEQYGQLKEGLEEVFEPYDIVDDKNAKKLKIKNGEIIFDKVNFAYEEDDKQSVFKNLSLTIPAGQKIGLVGESGAGKSTFVSLLLRFMDVKNGSIKIDDYDIRKIRQDDLRSAIAYVPQDPLLFHRTLAENIKYGNVKATDEEMKLATKRAHALDFINSFSQKFKTLVGERGVKLSGGQKQRVMIARAMLKKSPILVLDEATSSLDSRAEKLIQKALEELMKGRTTIVIAHRLSTLKQMDRIIVFDNGKIIEDGTHQELLAQRGKYFQLWQHQVGN